MGLLAQAYTVSTLEAGTGLRWFKTNPSNKLQSLPLQNKRQHKTTRHGVVLSCSVHPARSLPARSAALQKANCDGRHPGTRVTARGPEPEFSSLSAQQTRTSLCFREQKEKAWKPDSEFRAGMGQMKTHLGSATEEWR